MSFSPERLAALFSRHGLSAEFAAKVFRQLEDAYTSSARYYHNHRHIESLLKHFDETGVRNDALELAIWFHDFVYDSTRSDNEKQSVEYFMEMLGGILPGDSSEDVSRLILATDPRRPAITDDEKLISDIDLTILSASPQIYGQYTQDIRKEYSHVSDWAFREGRAAVLQNLLDKPIYQTSFFKCREPLARQNIQPELAALRQI